jgi:SHS2 domain-containing protein
MTSRWREIEDHTADTGIEVWGGTLKEVLLESAAAFSELTSIDFTDVGMGIKHEVTIEEDSADFLLHAFLNELLYLFDSKQFLAHTWIKPTIIETPDTYVFSCTLQGGTFVRGQHESGMEIKAVTWHRLSCEKIEEGEDEQWYAEVILDI